MSRGQKDKRKQAEAAGRRGEAWAAFTLQLKGYRILERRFKTKLGEIDLIAARGNTVAFIEVKHRKDFETAMYSVTDFQSDRITASAELYMANQRKLGGHEWRFDIMVTGARWWPHHVRDAWRD